MSDSEIKNRIKARNDLAADENFQKIHEMIERNMKFGIPDNCFAMIRLPVSASGFTAFARAAEKISPRCVTRTHGEFLMVLHPSE